MNRKTMHDFSSLNVEAPLAARRLLGAELIRTFDNVTLARARIVETEAYDQTDTASHSYKHQTPRTAVMFGPAGFLYVYFTYGMHHCMNIVCGHIGEGSAVLIRALEPITGVDNMTMNRGGRSGVDVANGPAKSCQALSIDRVLNGHDLSQSPLQLRLQPAISDDQIVQTTRVGISHAKNVPWRFYIKDNQYISRP